MDQAAECEVEVVDEPQDTGQQLINQHIHTQLYDAYDAACGFWCNHVGKRHHYWVLRAGKQGSKAGRASCLARKYFQDDGPMDQKQKRKPMMCTLCETHLKVSQTTAAGLKLHLLSNCVEVTPEIRREIEQAEASKINKAAAAVAAAAAGSLWGCRELWNWLLLEQLQLQLVCFQCRVTINGDAFRTLRPSSGQCNFETHASYVCHQTRLHNSQGF